MYPIGWIDCYQDNPSFRRGVLGSEPFYVVGRPNPYPVTLAKSCSKEGFGQNIHLFRQLLVCEPQILVQ